MWTTNIFVFITTMALLMVAAVGENNEDVQAMGDRQYHERQNRLRSVHHPIHGIPRPMPKPTLIQVVEPPTTSSPVTVEDIYLQSTSEPISSSVSPAYHRPVFSVRPNLSSRPLLAPRPQPRPTNVVTVPAPQPSSTEMPVVYPPVNPGRHSWTLQPRPSVTVIPNYVEEPATPTPDPSVAPSYSRPHLQRPLLPSRPIHRPNPINIGVLPTTPLPMPEPSTPTPLPPFVTELDPPVNTESPHLTGTQLPEQTFPTEATTMPKTITITELKPEKGEIIETTPAHTIGAVEWHESSPVPVTTHRPPTHWVSEARPRPPITNWRPAPPRPKEPIVPVPDAPISTRPRPSINNWRPRPIPEEPMVQPPVPNVVVPVPPTPEPEIVPEQPTPEPEVIITSLKPPINSWRPHPIPEEPLIQPAIAPTIASEELTPESELPISTSFRPIEWRPRPVMPPPVVPTIDSRQPEIQDPIQTTVVEARPTYKPLKKPSQRPTSGWTSSFAPPKPAMHDHNDHVINFQCNDDAYFPSYQECDAYIECRRGIAMEYLCPDGLHFNPNVQWPDYPCAYPSEVECVGRPVTQKPIPTADCPRQYGYFSMGNGECSDYIICQEGLATLMHCPPGLVFNPELSACDWPEKVPSCNPNVFQGFKCPPAPLDEDGQPTDLIAKYKYGDSCKNYVACQRGRPRLLSCDPGYSFDALSGYCIESDYVKNCEYEYDQQQQQLLIDI